MITIDAEILPKIQEWFAAGRGVTIWENREIASGASPEVFTPADCASAPNWRYGNPINLTPEQIQVKHSIVLESFRGRFKAMYWGPWVAPASEAKAQKLCAKHGVSIDSWRWEYDNPGYVKIEILRSEIRPYTA